MTADQMKQGIQYRVTRASKQSEFQVGDQIWLDKDGCLCCRQAQGWMEKADIPEATQGMECEVDAVWLARRKAAMEHWMRNGEMP